jgi:ATP-dependent helicase/nuclease subunit A
LIDFRAIQNYQNVASAPNKSVWVSANAGSGKTKVLIDRLVKLLLSGVTIDRICCLTYTKAAANEMIDRLQSIINEWAVLPETELKEALVKIWGDDFQDIYLRRARNLFFDYHEDGYGIKILTIHAFCLELLQQFPIEAKINPNPEFIDDERKYSIIIQAKNILLKKLHKSEYHDSELISSIILENIMEGKFNAALQYFCDNRLKYNCLFYDDAINNAALKQLYYNCNFDIELDFADNMRKILYCDDKIIQTLQTAAKILGGSDKKTDLELADKIILFLNSPQQISDCYALAKLFFTEKGTVRKNFPTTYFAKKAGQLLQLEWDNLAKLLQNYYQQYHIWHSVRLSHALMRIAYYYISEYQQLKQQKNLLDYNDLLEKTVKLLRDNSVADWVLYKLDGKIEHLLIDEAQDTSSLQWQITELIISELFSGQGSKTSGSLFVVGDEKQSIFGFQGAQPSEFVARADYYYAKAKLAYHDFVYVPLQFSFRTLPAILDFVDATFRIVELKSAVTMLEESVQHKTVRKGYGIVRLYPTVN